MVVIKNSPASCEEVREIARIASTCSSLEEVRLKVKAQTGRERSYHSIRSLLQNHRTCCRLKTLGRYMTGPREALEAARIEALEAARQEELHAVFPPPTPPADPRAEPYQPLPGEDRDPPTVRSARYPSPAPPEPAPTADRTWIDWAPEPPQYDPPHIVGRFVVFPDNHVPYHSKKAVRIAIEAAKHHIHGAFPGETTAIVIGGDFIDCQPVSRHFKDPSRSSRIQDEIDTANEVLDWYDEIKADSRFFQEGNHELRLPRYIAQHAPALVGMQGTTVPEMLRLRERGWKWIPYYDDVWLGKLMVTHDVERCGKYAVSQSIDDIRENVVINHVHRIGTVCNADAFGQVRVGASFGCLLDFGRVDWQQRRKVRRNMVHGIGLGYIDSTLRPWVVPVPIIDERYCVVDGRVIF